MLAFGSKRAHRRRFASTPTRLTGRSGGPRDSCSVHVVRETCRRGGAVVVAPSAPSASSAPLPQLLFCLDLRRAGVALLDSRHHLDIQPPAPTEQRLRNSSRRASTCHPRSLHTCAGACCAGHRRRASSCAPVIIGNAPAIGDARPRKQGQDQGRSHARPEQRPDSSCLPW